MLGLADSYQVRKGVVDEETLKFYRRNAEAYAGWAKAHPPG